MNAEKLAQIYFDSAAVEPATAEYDSFHAWINDQWEQIRDMVRFTFQEVEPERMMAHYDATGELLISAAHNEPLPWLASRRMLSSVRSMIGIICRPLLDSI